jgi:hypothetical protein
MENYQLDKDIRTICVTASSFPDGVMAAHDKIHSLVTVSAGSTYFGISRPDRTGKIIYKAAVDEQHVSPDVQKTNEYEKQGFEPFLIPKGTYTSIYIPDFMKDVQQIGQAFRQLLAEPSIDQNGFCLEMYVGDKDVRCMIRLS